MSNAAIVTGASSGIGLEIGRMLCRLGYEVFGIGRQFPQASHLPEAFQKQTFHPIVCDILDTQKLLDTVKDVASKNKITVLVNNAGTAYYGPHEELNPGDRKSVV